MTVSAPLRIITEPDRFAAARARVSLSAGFRSGKSLKNSPSCGVKTQVSSIILNKSSRCVCIAGQRIRIQHQPAPMPARDRHLIPRRRAHPKAWPKQHRIQPLHPPASRPARPRHRPCGSSPPSGWRHRSKTHPAGAATVTSPAPMRSAP